MSLPAKLEHQVVNVLGDAAEMGIVVLRDERDSQRVPPAVDGREGKNTAIGEAAREAQVAFTVFCL
jgi:hypothetical protein